MGRLHRRNGRLSNADRQLAAHDEQLGNTATIAAVNGAGVPFAFALSQTPRARITEETARVLAQHGRVVPVNIAQRVAYAETGATGQGVSETTDNKAGAEIAAVWDYVKGVLNG